VTVTDTITEDLSMAALRGAHSPYSQLVRRKESSHETKQEPRHALNRYLARLIGADTAVESRFFGTRYAHGHPRNSSGRFDHNGEIGRKEFVEAYRFLCSQVSALVDSTGATMFISLKKSGDSYAP
jgi:hypothetical protein